jgi:clathrin heavy chain
MNYISRLDNFDAPDIAAIALGSELFEEAFTIYKKYAQHVNAVGVLVNSIKSLDRGYQYAQAVDEAPVWVVMGGAYLEHGAIKDAVDAYGRAEDFSNYQAVITAAAGKVAAYEVLVPFLKRARVTVREAALDSELLYAYARLDRIHDLEDFLTSPNLATVNVVGDRCFQDQLYEAAKILFNSVSNWARLATSLVFLREHQAAVDCARKANSTAYVCDGGYLIRSCSSSH